MAFKLEKALFVEACFEAFVGTGDFDIADRAVGESVGREPVDDKPGEKLGIEKANKKCKLLKGKPGISEQLIFR